MPAAFDACRSAGGKIRTKTLKGGNYVHVCIPKGGGPSVAGYVKTRKKQSLRDDLRESAKEHGDG